MESCSSPAFSGCKEGSLCFLGDRTRDVDSGHFISVHDDFLVCTLVIRSYLSRITMAYTEHNPGSKSSRPLTGLLPPLCFSEHPVHLRSPPFQKRVCRLLRRICIFPKVEFGIDNLLGHSLSLCKDLPIRPDDAAVPTKVWSGIVCAKQKQVIFGCSRSKGECGYIRIGVGSGNAEDERGGVVVAWCAESYAASGLRKLEVPAYEHI
jgi:hypothetical protein